MADPRFFTRAGPFKLRTLAAAIGIEKTGDWVGQDLLLTDVSPIESATPSEITYCGDKRLFAALGQSKAGACLVRPAEVARVPKGTVALSVADPGLAYAKICALFYPAAPGAGTVDPRAAVDPSAKLGPSVTVGPFAVIGAGAEIGEGTQIGPGAVVGAGCTIGRGCVIGPTVSIAYSLIGDRVLIHAGACLGQDGFGFVPGADGHTKIPQLGRVIVQDDVEIGAGTAIDRGSGQDTLIGQGTKIDNLVQIGHNVRIGRHCVIAGEVGISGSCVIGDFVALGGKVGLSDHVTIGAGARVAAMGGVMREVPPGETHGGVPARPMKEFMRETALLTRLAAAQKKRARDE